MLLAFMWSPIKGGRCGIFAPSSPFAPERYQKGRAVIEALGFTVVEHPQIQLSTGYLAGDDRARTDAFHDLLADPSIDLLWAVRGGYGLHRIADRIDPAILKRADKPIVGFSDVCVIHWIAQQQGLIAVHGPVITQLGDVGEDERASLRAIFSGNLRGLCYKGERTIRSGVAEGRITGGCLSVLAPLAGTPFFPPIAGAILLLEDIGEATYRIDRLLSGLRLTGALHQIKGVVLGDFVGCEPRNEREPKIEEVLADRLGDLGVPVLSGLPIGHGKRNVAVPLGARVRLDADAQTLEVIEP